MTPALEVGHDTKADAVIVDAKRKKKADEPQKSAIQADLLYVLLASEIAGQRGQLGIALDGYMKAARLTQDAQVAERAAQIAWFAQKKDESIEALDIWLAKEPNNVAANRLKAGWQMATGDMEGALAQVDKLLSLPGADFKRELIGLVRRVGKLPDNAQGLAFMGRIAQRYEERSEAHYAYSLLAFQKGELIKAVEEIRRARALDPDWIELMILESQILTKLGNVEAAGVVIEEALQRAPDNSKLMMMQAQLLLGKGRTEAAEEVFREIVKRSPENYGALFSLGLLELQRGDREQAKRKFEQLEGVQEWSSRASFYLGRMALLDKNHKEAVSWFDRVAEGRLYLDAQMGAVQALTVDGQMTKARQRLVSLREQFPKHQVRLYLAEGELLRSDKQYQAAFDLYSEAIDLKPAEISLLYARSLVAERIDRLDILEKDLLQVLAEKPGDVNALNALGYTLANRTERFDEAEIYLLKALKIKPDDAAILDSYGWLQFKKGLFEEALIHLKRAYALNQDAEIAAHLGEVLWAVGEKNQAKKIWQEADAADPGNEYFRALKERFREAF